MEKIIRTLEEIKHKNHENNYNTYDSSLPIIQGR